MHACAQEPLPNSVTLGRGLADYLALPLEQYSLLDPRWITRPDAVHAPDVFVLKVRCGAVARTRRPGGRAGGSMAGAPGAVRNRRNRRFEGSACCP